MVAPDVRAPVGAPSRGKARAATSRVMSVIALVSLFLGFSAGAAAAVDTTAYETPVGTGEVPLTLAATGLDITVPVIIGLTLLAAGTAIVAVVALRGGRPGNNAGR